MKCIEEAKKDRTQGAIMYLDLDDFKHINDSLGHQYGDVLLQDISKAVSRIEGISNSCYRMGGDEFLALVYTDNPEAVVAAIHENTRKWHGTNIDELTVSVGFAAAADVENPTIVAIEKVADERMYREKARYYQMSGNNRRKYHSDASLCSDPTQGNP